MKKKVLGICMVSLMGLSDIHAQEENILWKNDPTYSVYNYKHPNKAAAAKKIQQQPISRFHLVQESLTPENTAGVMFPNKRIFAVEQTNRGKVKTPLAIRRKASEKLYGYAVEPETVNQLFED